MKKWMLPGLLMAALAAGSGVARAATSDSEIAKQIVHEIRMYPRYSVWDNVALKVREGNVEVSGVVSQPFKKDDIGRLVNSVPGVAGLTKQLRVLPLSPMDDELRIRVARAIYGYPALSRYASVPLAPIHIIVENGRVTLEGVVANEMDKRLAGIRASTAGMSFGPVVNNLVVEDPPPSRG
jgi:hyperosmotically inducible periplasmic protein